MSLLEKDAASVVPGEVTPNVYLASIAISLKRIADVVDPEDKSRGTFFEQADNWIHQWISVWISRR